MQFAGFERDIVSREGERLKRRREVFESELKRRGLQVVNIDSEL